MSYVLSYILLWLLSVVAIFVMFIIIMIRLRDLDAGTVGASIAIFIIILTVLYGMLIING